MSAAYARIAREPVSRATVLIAVVASPLFLVIQPIPSIAGNVQSRPSRDPDAAKLVTSDIDLFWKAYDQAKPGNRAAVLREQYLQKGSAGLKAFTRVRIGDANKLAKNIEQHPRYYASLREPSSKVLTYKGAIRAGFHKLKELYDDAVFPDVYFLIGRMNSGGTLTDTGLLIGVDMYGKTKDTPMEELGAWHRAVMGPIDYLPHIVAHELIHYQQKYPKADPSLLGKAIGEGSADFVGELISGKMINGHLHRYGDPRERELWDEFKREMNGTDASRWLYQGDRAKDRPADLGYYVGYKICQAYYDRSPDKKQAVKDILEIKDFKAFLKASGYEANLRQASPAK